MLLFINRWKYYSYSKVIYEVIYPNDDAIIVLEFIQFVSRKLYRMLVGVFFKPIQIYPLKGLQQNPVLIRKQGADISYRGWTFERLHDSCTFIPYIEPLHTYIPWLDSCTFKSHRKPARLYPVAWLLHIYTI